MTVPTFGFVIEYVEDIEAARRFYVDVVGLRIEREHPTFVQFEFFAIASDQSMTGTREREVYWLVEDAASALKRIGDGAKVVMPLTQQPFGQVFGIEGPAGQPIYLLQLARDRPSRAV